MRYSIEKYCRDIGKMIGGDYRRRPYLPIDYNTGAATTEAVEPYTNDFTYRFGDDQDVTRTMAHKVTEPRQLKVGSWALEQEELWVES